MDFPPIEVSGESRPLQVAVMDTRADHRVAKRPEQEDRGGWTYANQLIEREIRLLVVGGRRWKATADGAAELEGCRAGVWRELAY